MPVLPGVRVTHAPSLSEGDGCTGGEFRLTATAAAAKGSGSADSVTQMLKAGTADSGR